jgi:hypothetical protein
VVNTHAHLILYINHAGKIYFLFKEKEEEEDEQIQVPPAIPLSH